MRGNCRPPDERIEEGAVAMKEARPGRGAATYVLWAGYAAASMVGAAYGFQFGERVGGVLLGVVLALNCAAFCAVMLSGIAERIARIVARMRRSS
jgi:hypothetical protein